MEDQAVYAFKQQLLKLSNELLGDQLEKMKFLCPFIGKGIKERIKTGYELFEVLMERNKLSAVDTNFLSGILAGVGRRDLADKLTSFSTVDGGSAPVQDDPSDPETVKINLAAEVIAQNLGRAWRKLARKLSLTEVKVQSISQKQLDLEDTTMEVIREWRKAQGNKACAEQLVVALRGCSQNLTADKVEDKIHTACLQ